MTVSNEQLLRAGALNLLRDCAGAGSGDKLVVVYEPKVLGWYDEVSQYVAEVAKDIGLNVAIREAAPPGNAAFDEHAVAGTGWDSCIYFARVGDQIRFDQVADGRSRVMCYASTLDALASLYGTAPHAAMLDMKRAVDEAIAAATTIKITCPLGTEVTGTVEHHDHDADVTVRRFPMGVHAPVDASRFSGRIIISRYITTTASRVYEPPWIEIAEPVAATLDKGRLTNFSGRPDDVAKIETHYQHVAQLFDLDRDNVHSWHAGIHPGRSFAESASVDPDRWSNTVFTSPRFVHFHTCGSEPPGEVSLTIPDPTITLDGVALWDNGVLHPSRTPSTGAALDRWPELSALFDGAKAQVGLPA